MGAKLAFKNDQEKEEIKRKQDELNCIFSYYGYLINLFHGYNASAKSLKQSLINYHLENNLSKLQNNKLDWGCLNFIMQNSNELFEKTFKLEKDIDILIEKTKLYSDVAGQGDNSINPRVIALRQLSEVYIEIIAMITSYDNYVRNYYNRPLVTENLMQIIKEAESLSKELVNNISGINNSLGDNKDFLKRIEDKKDWFMHFNK